jgi:hypothetical protein
MEWKNLAVLRAGRVDQVKVLVNKTFLYFFEEHFLGASLVPVKMDQNIIPVFLVPDHKSSKGTSVLRNLELKIFDT